MRPTFMGFESSKSALFASQKALDIVGQNLANMSSEGYTRQRTDQVAIDSYGYNNRLSVNTLNYTGMGTSVEGVSQVRDERMDTAFRSSYAETSYYSKKSDMMSEMEDVLSEIDIGVDGNGYGLSWGLEQLYTALEECASNINVRSDVTLVAEAVGNVTTLLNHISSTLTETCETYKDDLGTEVSDANVIMEDIADLNKQIEEIISTNGYTQQYGPNELIDKRNVLLDELSAFGKIEVKQQANGTVDVKLNGHDCITGKKADIINYQRNNNGTVSLRWNSDGTPADKDNGILRAAAEVINGRGNNITSAYESTERGFRYYQDYLDTFAGKLAEVLNNTIPDTMDEDGNILTYKKLVGESDTSDGTFQVYSDRHITAANIAVTDDLKNDPSYIIYDKNSSENNYMIELIGKISANQQVFTNGTETFKGTFQEFITDYAGKLGNDVYYAKSRAESTEKYSNQLASDRDNVTGVSETEETINMLTYNKAFQAAAKMMTTMDELLDIIVNQIGALG